MGEVHPFEKLEAVPLSEGSRRTDEVPKAVDGANSGVLEWRYEERAREMRGMMLYIMNSRQIVRGYSKDLGQWSTELPHLLRILQPISNEIQVRSLRQGVEAFPNEVCFWISTYGDVIEIRTPNAGDSQTLLNGTCREARAVLDSSKTLFFERRKKLPVLQYHGGDVAMIRVDP